jgi:hypothetical protein
MRRGQVSQPWHSDDRALRALALLKNNLTPTQREQFETQGYFDVVGGTTGARYRIWWGQQMNVQELDGKHLHGQWLCFVPSGNLPVGDILLAQKIALEVCEEAVLNLARRSSQRAWLPPVSIMSPIGASSLPYGRGW